MAGVAGGAGAWSAAGCLGLGRRGARRAPTRAHAPLAAPCCHMQFTEKPHYTMCSLVVVNSACNTALPLFIDR